MKRIIRILLTCFAAVLLVVSCGTSKVLLHFTEETKREQAKPLLEWLTSVYEMYYDQLEAPSDVAVPAKEINLSLPEAILSHLNSRVMCERYFRHLDFVKSHHIEASLGEVEIVNEKLHVTCSFAESREVEKEGAARDLRDTVFLVVGLDDKGQLQLLDYCSTAYFDESVLGELDGTDEMIKPEPFKIDRWAEDYDRKYLALGKEMVEFYQQNWTAHLLGLE